MAQQDFNYHGPVVVFDLDDTLMREREYVRSGFRLIEQDLIGRYGAAMLGVALRMNSRLIRRENYFDLLEEILTRFHRKHSGDSTIAAAEAEKMAKDEVDRLVALYRNHQPESLSFAKGAEDVLRELQGRGVAMALVTDGRSATQRAKIRALGLESMIPLQNIYISEEKGVDKTAPDSFQEIVRSYPEAKGFIYVGDNEEKDFLMPNLLGWKTCKVSRNYDNVHAQAGNDDILKVASVNLTDFSQLLEEI